MATTKRYRTDLDALVRLAEQDLAELWRRANSPSRARNLLIDVLPRLVDVYGSAAATLAADWYEERRAAAEVTGRFTAITATLPDRGRTDALARWGTQYLFTTEPDFNGALTLVAGGFQRIIADAGRYTVTGSSVADPKARGWERVGDGGCEFCQMLIGRGSVYTEASADFESHDHCQCAAVPVFD